MNGGTGSTNATLTGQANDPTALLNTLMASASAEPAKILPSGLGGDTQSASAASTIPSKNLTAVTPTPAGTLKDGIFGYGYYDPENPDPLKRFTAATKPEVTPPVVPPVVPPAVEPVVPPAVEPVVPPAVEPSIPRKKLSAGEGSINLAGDAAGQALTSFLASFQAAYKRLNPDYNFTRNPRLAKGLGLPWSGDLGV